MQPAVVIFMYKMSMKTTNLSLHSSCRVLHHLKENWNKIVLVLPHVMSPDLPDTRHTLQSTIDNHSLSYSI